MRERPDDRVSLERLQIEGRGSRHMTRRRHGDDVELSALESCAHVPAHQDRPQPTLEPQAIAAEALLRETLDEGGIDLGRRYAELPRDAPRHRATELFVVDHAIAQRRQDEPRRIEAVLQLER